MLLQVQHCHILHNHRLELSKHARTWLMRPAAATMQQLHCAVKGIHLLPNSFGGPAFEASTNFSIGGQLRRVKGGGGVRRGRAAASGVPSEGKAMHGDVKDSSQKKGFASKAGQSFNSAGILLFLEVFARRPELAVPHIGVRHLSALDWRALRNAGFEGVVFDKDNTLTAPYARTLWPPLQRSLEACCSAFQGRIALLSNSAGLYQYDPEGEEAEALERDLGIPVIRHEEKKPAGGVADLARHFGCEPTRLIMVGDRYLTDVVYGNRNGLLTIRPEPFTSEGEPFVVKRVRALEDGLLRRWERKGVKAPPHPLVDSSQTFLAQDL